MSKIPISYSISHTQAGWQWEICLAGRTALQGIAEDASSARLAALASCTDILQEIERSLPGATSGDRKT
jgi:hypothetical protein